MRSIRKINFSRLIPGPRVVRWDYRSGTHYWLTQWKSWIFSAVILVLAVVDLAVDGQPLDNSWLLWGIWFTSGLIGTFVSFLTWHRWIGPIIAQRNARRDEVRTQIAGIDRQLAGTTLEPWDRRRLELQREMHCEELEIVSTPRTTIPSVRR